MLDTLRLEKRNIEGWTLSITHNGLKQWRLLSSVKNGLDGMMREMYKVMSIWQKLLKYASSRLTPNTGYQLKSGNTCQPLKRFQQI
jgi:hypothetical protein